MTSKEFQHTQVELQHHLLLNYVPIGCNYEDALAEILKALRLGVVLDKRTSKSRTSWLAGEIENQSILIVLDTSKRDEFDYASLDIWCDVEELIEEILTAVRNSRLGDVNKSCGDLDISWAIDYTDASNSRLVISLSATSEEIRKNVAEIVFTVDYQGVMSETLKTVFPAKEEQVSFAIELDGIKSEWSGNLEEPFITLYIGDSEWKSPELFHRKQLTWRTALIQQIESKLAKGTRFTDFSEVSEVMNLDTNPSNEKARSLFLAFCLAHQVEGCKSQRVSDYCRRCVVLSGLVICFNPPRGLSGYLEMVCGPSAPLELERLGTERTWRDHLTGLVTSAHDFQPTPVEIRGKKKSRGPGRPPTQLLPTIPPVNLFRDFINSPEKIVCRYCKFSNEVSR
ncbi:hypothetical protein EU528_06990 [Candidatus Thorarchaeota archaeon]|nr:MAG: hypothetical protein EU528_06990 [Candidatus Thorarchaeota archaeon]